MIEEICVFYKEIFSYKEMLISLVRKDLRTRYKGSFLGFLWTFINPLMTLVVYSLVFPYVMRVQEKNYAMFLFVALLPWIFFTTSLQISSNTIVSNSNLVKKIYFPRQVLPISVATTGLMNYIFSLAIVFISLLIVGIGIKWTVIFIPLLLFVEYLLILGLCLILSALNVYFRDLEHIIGILLNAWFYLTPVIYPISIFPEHLLWLLNLNPMTPIIVGFRDALYYGNIPNMKYVFLVFLISIILNIAGILLFRRLEKGFAEEI